MDGNSLICSSSCCLCRQVQLIQRTCTNETLYRWTFNFHKVVRQQNSGPVEDFILLYSAVYLRIQLWKNYWNRSTFAKVIVKIKVARFLWPTVYTVILRYRTSTNTRILLQHPHTVTSTWSCLKRFSRSYFSPSRRTMCVCSSRALSDRCDVSMPSISRGLILCFKIALFSASSCSFDFFPLPSPYTYIHSTHHTLHSTQKKWQRNDQRKSFICVSS